MNFVEIIANEKKPKLTGGRRGSATLQNGNNAVSSNLVPVSHLPPSAGSLASVMSNLKPKALKSVLQHPSEHQAEFNKLLKNAPPAPTPIAGGKRRGRPKKGGAIVVNPDGTTKGVGSDDPNFWSRMPKKGGAYLGPDGKVHTPKNGLIGATKGGKMSKLVPRHGHGANTQIGTNYQLGQFGGAIQPIGNTASTLSPVLSIGSVGAGRKCAGKRPKGKNLKKLIDIMVKARNHLHGDGFWGDAWDSVKGIAQGLYHEFGPQIFEASKETLLDALKEGAKHYITGGKMDGGDFWGDVWNGVKAFGTMLWDVLKEVLNSEIVKEIQHEILKMGLTAAKEYAGAYLAGTTGAGFTPPPGMKPIGSDPRTWSPIWGAHPYRMPDDDYKFKGGKRKQAPHSGEKPKSKRGAIVSKIMKEKGLSLPMASKYVKEHGLY